MSALVERPDAAEQSEYTVPFSPEVWWAQCEASLNRSQKRRKRRKRRQLIALVVLFVVLAAVLAIWVL